MHERPYLYVILLIIYTNILKGEGIEHVTFERKNESLTIDPT